MEGPVNEIMHITIKTIDGDEDQFEFKQTVLVGEAMKRFGIVPPAGEKYRLAEKKDDNYRPLDDRNLVPACVACNRSKGARRG